ncbi:NYN domain-containing protein [Nocardia wallacei]|uniref:NYN domain-containing protein n=1 Tax=Nocardia wallacei TaxID=480035 RepID=UPI0024579713|nr:NYN domain-containing protein [Nocardia wallacei]
MATDEVGRSAPCDVSDALARLAARIAPDCDAQADTDGARHPIPPKSSDASNPIEVAVLIDADNVPAARIGLVLKTVSEYGTPHIRRAYGDWSRPQLTGWRPAMLAHAIRPMHAAAFSVRKNVSDHAIVAGAVELLYTSTARTFVLVSSDADFAGLALRLRESGRTVYGFGEHKTPTPFVTACDRFTYIEDLDDAPGSHDLRSAPPRNVGAKSKSPATTSISQNPAKAPCISAELADRLCAVVDGAADVEGWANLATVCHRLHSQLPDLNRALNGQSGKPGRFLKTCGLFEVADRRSGNGKGKTTYLRPCLTWL